MINNNALTISLRPVAAVLLATALLTACGESPPAADADGSAPASSQTSQTPEASEASSLAGDEIIAVVNGVSIPKSRLSVYVQGVPVTEDNMPQLIDNIIASELIAQAARAAGYADRPEIKNELVVAEQAVLGRAYAGDVLKANPVGEEKIQESYQDFVKTFGGGKEYQVAHILVEDEEEAQSLLAKIKADETLFGELAKAHSQDSGSAARDGELGWIEPRSLVPTFAAAMEKLDKGGISQEPVKTDYGWHIIRVDDVREKEAPPLNDELRQRIQQMERADALNKEIENLRKNATVEIL